MALNPGGNFREFLCKDLEETVQDSHSHTYFFGEGGKGLGGGGVV